MDQRVTESWHWGLGAGVGVKVCVSIRTIVSDNDSMDMELLYSMKMVINAFMIMHRIIRPSKTFI